MAVDIEKTVKEIVGSKIKGDNFTRDTELSSLGLDSLDKAEILIDIEDKFGIEFDDEEMKTVSTVGDLFDIIEKKVNK